MIKFSWLKWFLFLVITLLSLELLKTLVTKFQFSANYLVAVILICLQTLVILGFLYYAAFVNLFKRRLKTGKILMYVSTSFVCFVALLEILFTHWLYHPAKIASGLKWSYKYYYDSYNFRIIQYEKSLISFDNELLYTLKPGTNVNFRNAEFSTSIDINKDGFRDDDTSVVAPEIICLGDSFTMGWGVEESQTFPEILQKEMGKKVLNAGIPSYGTARELLLLNRLDISRLKYIIIQYCSNDMDENNSFITNNYKLKLTPLSVYKSSMRSYELARKYFPGKNFLLISQLWMKHQFNKVYPFFKLSAQPYSGEFNSRQQAAVFLKTLSVFYEKLKDVKVIVTNVDVYKYHDNYFIEELNRQIEQSPEASKMNNIILVNSITGLTENDYFTLDYHINPSGHEKVANSLFQAIKGPLTD